MSLDIRHLRCFTLLAEELHFGRTANRLGMAQSGLSAHIARLEDVIGGRLIERGRKTAVRLTPLGRTFLAEAEAALAQLDRAERIGRSAAQGEAGPMRLSYVFSAALSGTLARALRILGDALPLLEVTAFPLETPEQITALQEARVDAGLLRPQSRYPQGISAAIVHREKLLLALTDRHPLARLDVVPVAALAREAFIVPQMTRSMGLPMLVEDLARAGGFPAPVNLDASDFVTAASMAAAGQGVVLAPRSLSNLRIDGIAYRPVEGYSGAVELALAWRGEESPAIQAILRGLARGGDD